MSAPKKKVVKKARVKKSVKKVAKTSVKTAKTKIKRVVKKAALVSAEKGAIQVFDLKGKAVDTLVLDPMFLDAINTDVIYQAILKYQAGEREGTASTKNRGDVRGGGKKPWKQKGTGQARHGSRRSPIWRGGGVTFGPSPRDYSYSIPTQIKRKAVTEVMKDKVAKGNLYCLNQITIEEPKTKRVVSILNTFKLKKPLFLVDQKSDNLVLASRNLQSVSIKTTSEVNALDLAKCTECVMTKAAYTGLVKRLKA